MKAGSWSRAAAVVAAALLLLVVGWWALPPDPVAVLQRHWSPLARVERVVAPEVGAPIERWRMITAAGDTVTGLWRAAPPGTPRPWTIVMLGGLQTGDRAVLLLPSQTAAHALAVDWPWSGRRTLSAWEIAERLAAIQDAVLRSPAVLAVGVEAVTRQSEVDPSRVAVLGASLGVPPAVAALRLPPAPHALVLIDGAADLEVLLRAALIRERVPGALAAPLAALGFRLIRPLEPSLHAGATPHLPVLILNSRRDPLLPRAAVERLHAGFPGADIRWRADTHIRPRRLETIAALAGEIDSWLRALPPVR